MYFIRFFLSIGILFILFSGCSNGSKNNNYNDSKYITQDTQHSQDNNNFNEEVERPSDQFMLDLRMALNLSFKIFQAMESKDYLYLESVSDDGVTIDRENNQVIYFYSGNEINYNFIEGINFNNLEYWGSGYSEDYSKFSIVFAKYYNDTHGNIYFDFVKKDGEWLFSGLSLN